MPSARYHLTHPTDAILSRDGSTIDWPATRPSFSRLHWAGLGGQPASRPTDPSQIVTSRGVRPFALHFDWNSTAGFGTVFLAEPLYRAAAADFGAALDRLTSVAVAFGKKALPYRIGLPAAATLVDARIDVPGSVFFSCDFNDHHRFGTRALRGRTLFGDEPPVAARTLTFASKEDLDTLRRDAWKTDVAAHFLPRDLSLKGPDLPALLLDRTALYLRRDVAAILLDLHDPETPGIGCPFPAINVAAAA